MKTPLKLMAFTAALVVLCTAIPAMAGSYAKTILVADQESAAKTPADPDLRNAWGITRGPTSPFWVANNDTGTSTLYRGDGTKVPLTVTVPAPEGSSATSTPTGVIFNGTTGFVVSGNGGSGPAVFIFVTEDGTISGWNPAAAGPGAMLADLAVDNSALGIAYKGLELGHSAKGNVIYVTNFTSGTIDVFDSNFKPITLEGSFEDPRLPAGYAPHNIRHIGSLLYVTYAKQDAAKADAIFGKGFGFVNLFDLNGNFLRRLISDGALNAPWGIALAPADFGDFSNALLVANLGDGKINAFDQRSGALLGTLKNSAGLPIAISGLWGLTFGNGNAAGNTNELFFTAGPTNYTHGRFGKITAVP